MGRERDGPLKATRTKGGGGSETWKSQSRGSGYRLSSMKVRTHFCPCPGSMEGVRQSVPEPREAHGGSAWCWRPRAGADKRSPVPMQSQHTVPMPGMLGAGRSQPWQK